MHRIEIPAINYINEYAGKWEELKPKEVLYASSLLYMVVNKDLHPLMFKKLMIDKLLRRKNNAKKVSIFDLLDGKSDGEIAENVVNYWGNEAKLAETMNFFFDIKTEKDENGEEIDKYDISPGFIANLVPCVKIGFTKYYGPADFIGDLSLIELKEAVVCCEEYNESKDKAMLDRLAAILYRKRKKFLWFRKLFYKYDGNKRREYNPYNVIRNIKKFGKVNGIGFYCYLFFNSVLNYIYTQPVKLDGHEYDFSVLLKGSGNDNDEGANNESLGFTGILYALGETGIFGDIEKTAKANIFDVFVSLYRGYLVNKEMERSMKIN
jgi:hypothetical protein